MKVSKSTKKLIFEILKAVLYAVLGHFGLPMVGM